MPSGRTTTGVLADSLDTVVASARRRREFDGVVPQLVERVTLDPNTGLDWKETLFERLNAQAITENTVNENFQQLEDSAINITPQMVQIATFFTDRMQRRLNTRALAQIGSLAGEAMERKKDEDGLAALDGSSTQLGSAGSAVTTGLIASARYRITSNATEPGPMPIRSVFHGFHLKDFYDELVAGVGTYVVDQGPTATVFQQGFRLPVAGVEVFEDGNISVDANNDAKGFVFSQMAWVLVEGMTLRRETARRPDVGGGGDAVYITDEYAYGERSPGNWSFEIIGDATAPTS